MKRRPVVLASVLVALAALLSTVFVARSQGQKQAAADGTIVVPMSKADAQRRGRFDSTVDFQTLVTSGPPVDHLTHRGTIEVDGTRYAIYLPEAKAYSLENRGTGADDFHNTSTCLSIDADGDGRLTDDEGWFASLPVRIGDRMFDITAITADGTSISLRPSTSPLRGLIVGRRVPPFELKLPDGRTISDVTLLGKPCVLDIWSVT